MSSTNKTTNYELSQYVGSDKPTYLGDYNGDMLKIDTQMKTNADAASAAAAAASTADGKAVNAASAASTADGKAVNAQNTADSANSTANSALSKATANETAIAGITNKGEWNAFTNYQYSAYRINKNMVEVSVYADSLSQALANFGSLTLHTLPAQYRPDRNLRLPVFVRTVGGSFVSQCYLEIKSTGEVNIYNWGVNINIEAIVGYVAFPVSYVAE